MLGFSRTLLFILYFAVVSSSSDASSLAPVPCIPAWNQFSGSDNISSTIQSSVKGNDSLIYLGGRDALYRIEGGDVHTWFPDFTDDSALPSGRVKALAVEGDYIWVGSNSGVARLDTRTGLFERNDTVNQYLGFRPVNALLVSGDYLFVGNSEGGGVVKLSTRIEDVEPVQKFDTTGALAALTYYQDKILAVGEQGLWQLKPDEAAQQLGFNDESLHAIHALEDSLWVVSSVDLLRKVQGTSQWQRFTQETLEGLPEGDLTTLASDKLGRLWIGSTAGLSRWNLNEAHPVQCRRATTGSNRDQDISIAHLSGQLGDYMLLGSSGNGAAFAPVNHVARRVVPGGHYDSGLPPNPIWSHLVDTDGRFIAGTSKGLFKETFAQSGYFESVAADIVGGLRIYSIAKFENSELWVGTSKGLFIDRGEGITPIAVIFDETQSDVSPAIFAIKRHKNRILVASAAGLLVFDYKSGELLSFFKTHPTHQTAEHVKEIPISTARLWSIDTYQSRVFVAGNEGVFEVDIDTPSIVRAFQSASNEMSQPVGYIYNVLVAQENRLLLGTESGLVETNFDFTAFNKITEVNGKKLLAVMSSGRDSFGDLWFGVANSGLFRYQPQNNSWTHLTQSNGLITNGVSQLGLSFSNDGVLVVSNGTGASIVDIERFDVSQQSELQIQAIDGPRNHLFDKDEVYHIAPEERDLVLSFLATELIEPGLHSVEYQLSTPSGVTRQSSVPLDEVLTFINLSPGLYDFTAVVKATSGVVSEAIHFQFQITPYWWETIMFEVVVAFVLLAVLVAFFLYRTRLIEQRMDIIAEERKRIARELHDTSLQDVFGARMLGRTLMYDLPDESKEKSDRFVSLIDKAIQSLRTSVDSLSKLTDVPPLSKAIETLNHDIFLPEGTQVIIRENGRPWAIKQQIRFFVYRILREAANNAAKHAQCNTITISLEWRHFYLIATVTDDGQGFNVEEAMTTDTYGLRSMECMARNAKVKFNIESDRNRGTSVQIRLLRLFA